MSIKKKPSPLIMTVAIVILSKLLVNKYLIIAHPYHDEHFMSTIFCRVGVQESRVEV